MIDPDHLRAVLRAFYSKRLVVVGDLLLDEYIEGDATRLSPEAPVPVVDITERRYQLGGAGNVAHNILALGAECSLFGVVGTDLAGTLMNKLGMESGLGGVLVTQEDWTTPHKARVVARGQQIVRLDREVTGQALDRLDTHLLLDQVTTELMRAHGLILSDYGKGTLSPKLIHGLIHQATHYNVPVFVDPKKIARTYEGATLIKPNAAEARTMTSCHTLEAAGVNISARAGGADVVITCGAHGCLVFSRLANPITVPTTPQRVVDVQGAGDTAMAALALARCCSASLVEAAMIANAAAGAAVSKPGTATATIQEFSGEPLGRIIDAQREGDTDGD
jgi:D-beta-D-heptose 7-phosphate kinase/D-beta-D-heptose 1-phosphate adenosyltransferase